MKNHLTGAKLRMLHVLQARWSVGEAAKHRTALNLRFACLLAAGAIGAAVALPMGSTALALDGEAIPDAPAEIVQEDNQVASEVLDATDDEQEDVVSENLGSAYDEFALADNSETDKTDHVIGEVVNEAVDPDDIVATTVERARIKSLSATTQLPTVLSADDLKQALEGASSGDTVTLGADIEYIAEKMGQIVITSDVTLDFAGYAIDAYGTKDLISIVAKGAKLTLRDAIFTHYRNFVCDNYGTINVESGSFDVADFVENLYEGSTLSVESGSFQCSDTFFDEAEGATIVIKDATITCDGYLFDDMTASSITIKDGSFMSEDDLFYLGEDNVVIVQGGTFNSKEKVFHIEEGTTLTLSGGSYYAREGVFYPVLHSTDWEAFAQGIISEGYHATLDEFYNSSSFRVVPDIVTATFVAEGEVISAQTAAPEALTAPTLDKNSNGASFLFWKDSDGKRIQDIAATLASLERDAAYAAVFTDSKFVITFHDNGKDYALEAYIYTPLGQVEGLDRTDVGDSFYAWKIGEGFADAASTQLIDSDLDLTACYVSAVVHNQDELIAALEAGLPVIKLANDITVTQTIVANHDCIIAGDGFGLIRPDDFLGALFQTSIGVVGGDEDPGVSSNNAAIMKNVPSTGSVTVTMKDVLVDGRNIKAGESAVVVDADTTLILHDTTVQNNDISEVSDWRKDSGGGVYVHGVLKLYDGTSIRNNVAINGGGVFVVCSYRDDRFGTLYMYGGEIAYNTALDGGHDSGGGGVKVDGYGKGYGTFYMYGGSIHHNTAESGRYGSGGGVTLSCGDQGYEDGEIVMHMYGGEIVDNYAAREGGGIFVACGSLVMEGGIIARNVAGENGGAISACCGCDLNVKIIGGNIYLNCAPEGGGIGAYVGGIIAPDLIFDNLADDAGDDLTFKWCDSMDITKNLADRAYGDSYASDEELSDYMKSLIASALPTIYVEELGGKYASPIGVMIPFSGWYVDGNSRYREDTPRYSGGDGETFEKLFWENYEDGGNSAKAIWNGVVLAYDANHDDNAEYTYDPQGYVPDSTATVRNQDFQRNGYRLVGWSATPDGSSGFIAPGESLVMDHSKVLYAQWQQVFKVTYEVTGDVVYGSPADAVVPIDDNEYASGDTVMVAELLATSWGTSDGTADGSPGTWVFSSWDKEGSFVIEGDIVIHGSWVFTPEEPADPEDPVSPSDPDDPSHPADPEAKPIYSKQASVGQQALPATADDQHTNALTLTLFSMASVLVAAVARKLSRR